MAQCEDDLGECPFMEYEEKIVCKVCGRGFYPVEKECLCIICNALFISKDYEGDN